MEDWRQSAIVYQVNLRSLAFREPRNPFEAAAEQPPATSPLACLSENLDAVAALGVTTLCLMPIFAMGVEGRKGLGSPYAIRDYTAVDPEFGTHEELHRLVACAHERGLHVLLDITPNHTSRDHVWTVSHREFHVRDADGRCVFDGDWSDTAKLNYRSAALRAAMVDALDFWLRAENAGVDGFRFDMAHILNDLSFWNEALPELERRHAGRRLLFLAESYGFDANLDLLGRGLHAAYDDDLYKVWPCLYAADAAGRTVIEPDREARGRGDLAPLWAAYAAGGLAGAVERALTAYEERFGAETPPWLLRYSDNHDEGRGLFRFGAGAARAINQLVFLAPRTLPMLLSGQEYGAENRPPIHTRMGVCDKSRRVVLSGGATRRDAGIELEGNVFARSPAGRRAWYEFFRRLVGLRRRTPELTRGSFVLLDAGEETGAGGPGRTVVAFERAWQGGRVRCAVNLGPEPRRLRGAGDWAGERVWGVLDEGVLDAFAAVAIRDCVRG